MKRCPMPYTWYNIKAMNFILKLGSQVSWHNQVEGEPGFEGNLLEVSLAALEVLSQKTESRWLSMLSCGYDLTKQS